MAIIEENKEQVLKRYREGVTWMLENDGKVEVEQTWIKGLKKIEELEDRARELGVTNDELGEIIEKVKVKLGRHEGTNTTVPEDSTKNI